eukprot:NODE_600_length_1507_cov_352.349794_g449_i0.p1 GENE.NODE_600_length_1507_cov_352.349794_g449_i0~~NODE_600_length_1507_cov_352.349794_g449_i0.p1  ORF type:complete len:433 (-),score=115.29 NODE_600_length_1507_cov_352.349794_g449_i0:152-1450(-)
MAALDLEQYAGQYVGMGKICRLLHIVKHSPQHATDAARMAAAELQKGKNTTLYREVCKQWQEKGMPVQFDEPWVTQVDENAARTIERLETELSAAKSNLIKESIRLGYNELGAFYLERGELPNSLKSYIRSREYCTTSKQILEMYLNVIRVALGFSNFSVVTQNVGKAEQSPDYGKDKRDVGKLKVAAGLSNLDARKYRPAARKFIETPFEMGNSFAEMFSANDVATFGGLCALATYDRNELKRQLIDNANFKNYLELVPEVREIIKDFYESRYTTCLGALEKLKDVLLLDIYLRPHVAGLYEMIRQRALKQYVSPFMSVDLNKMAAAFNTSTQLLEKELAQLIMDGKIQVRIDSHNKILYAQRDNERVITFSKTIEAGQVFVADTEASIRRLNMLRCDFQVKHSRVASPQAGQQHAAGQPGSAGARRSLGF